MTPAQFDEWREFYSLEPWGARFSATPLASILVAMAAAFGKELDVDDVMRSWDIDIPDTTPVDGARAIIAGFGG